MAARGPAVVTAPARRAASAGRRYRPARSRSRDRPAARDPRPSVRAISRLTARPEAGPLLLALGREERLEQPVADRLRDARIRCRRPRRSAKRGFSASTRARTWTTGCAMPATASSAFASRLIRICSSACGEITSGGRSGAICVRSVAPPCAGGTRAATSRAPAPRRARSAGAASCVAGTDSRRRLDTSDVSRSDCSTMWRAKSSTSSSSTRSFSSSSCARPLIANSGWRSSWICWAANRPNSASRPAAASEIAQPRDGFGRSRRRRRARAVTGVCSAFVAHLSACFFHRSVASGVSAGGGGGRRVSVVVACFVWPTRSSASTSIGVLPMPTGHRDRKLSVGADGGGLQPAGRAHGHDRRRRRAALDLGVLAVAIDGRPDDVQEHLLGDVFGILGGAPRLAGGRGAGRQRDRLAAGGEARRCRRWSRPRRGRSRRPAPRSAPDPRWWCGVARVDRQRAGVADAREHLAAAEIDAGAARRRGAAGGAGRRRPRSRPAPAAAGPPALHASSRISTPARSSISVPAARRSTAPDAADVRTTSERVSLSPCLIGAQPSAALRLHLAGRRHDLEDVRLLVAGRQRGAGRPRPPSAARPAPVCLGRLEQPARHARRDHHDRDRDQRERRPSRYRRARRHARCARPGVGGERQHELRARAGRALDLNRAAVVLDDAVDERQPQPGARAIARPWS